MTLPHFPQDIQDLFSLLFKYKQACGRPKDLEDLKYLREAAKKDQMILMSATSGARGTCLIFMSRELGMSMRIAAGFLTTRIR